MSSTKQTEANRRNGKRSKGPKTKEGKAISSMNAVKHGLTSKRTILPAEDPIDVHELFDAYAERYFPAGALELYTLMNVAILDWKIRKTYRLEVEIFEAQRKRVRERREELNKYQGVYNTAEKIIRTRRKEPMAELYDSDGLLKAGMIDAAESVDAQLEEEDDSYAWAKDVIDMFDAEPWTDGEAFVVDAGHENALANLSRYRTSFERSLDRALARFHRLQAERREGEASRPVATEKLERRATVN